MNKRIMVASGKGGTGKSMVASNLALTLAYRGHKTVLIDMDMGLRTLDLYMGVQNAAVFDMYDVICGTCEMSRAVIDSEFSDRLSLLAACQSRSYEAFTADKLREAVSVMEDEYGCEYVIMDCPPGLGYVIEACAACADMAILVVNPDYASMRDADAVEDYLIRQSVMNRRYIVNRIVPELANKGVEMGLSEVDSRLKCDPVGMIPEDMNFRASMHSGMPLVCKRDTYIADNFDKIAERVIESFYAP